MTRPFAAALTASLWVGLAAAPALAAPPPMSDAAAPCCAPAAPAAAWFAPLTNTSGQDVALFGILPVPANEAVWDRALRLVAGAGLIGLAATDPTGAGMPLRAGAGAAGGVLLWTSLTGACPAYMPFGWSTREAAAR